MEEKPNPDEASPPDDADRRMRQMSRRSFLWSLAAVGTGFAGWRWLVTRPGEDGVIWPLRRSLRFNEKVAGLYFRGAALAPTFPPSRADPLRMNGRLGLGENFDPAAWKLRVTGAAVEGGTQTVELQEIKALPRVEMTTELKCIEGWSVIVNWAGARLADFIERYPPAPNVTSGATPGELPKYIGLSTPDGGYYVGLDMASALHPQTLLCYEMNGAPLTLEHGAPLRLAIPLKYGIKNLKRIGTLAYTNERPADYWAERGYDWYAGH